EYSNVCAALEWSLERMDGGDASLRIASSLSFFWYLRGIGADDTLALLIRVLEYLGASMVSTIPAHLLIAAGRQASAFGTRELADTFMQESLAIHRELKDRKGVGESLLALGRTSLINGNHSLALRFLEESLQVAREVNYKPVIWGSLFNLGNV